MRAERVYEAANRLRVPSRRLLVFLKARSMPHRSASSALSPAAIQALADVTTTDVLSETPGHLPPKARQWIQYWRWEDEEDDWRDERYTWAEWSGPDELTTAQAAAAYRVVPATIRQWVRRGHLQPLRREGRTVIFDAREVNSAALATGDRNKQPGGALGRRGDSEHEQPPGRGLSRQRLNELVTADIAARAVGVSPSTIRSWRKRGHLQTAAHHGRTPLYRLNDVVAAARRPKHRPRRIPRPLI